MNIRLLGKIVNFSLFLVFFMSHLFSYDTQIDKNFVIVVTAKNDKNSVRKNLESIFSQTYKKYRVIYFDDFSKDNTGNEVEKLLIEKSIDYGKINFDDQINNDITAITKKFSETINQQNHSFILVQNLQSSGAQANLYRAVHSCNDEDVIIKIDGGDYLYNDNVFEIINREYAYKEIWMTHGKTVDSNNNIIVTSVSIPTDIVDRNRIRDFPDSPTNLCTFYSWLYKKINLSDLIYNGKFFPGSCDLAYMFPMFEMSAEKHSFINKPTYVLNTSKTRNKDRKIYPFFEKIIRDRESYNKLEKSGYQSLDRNSYDKWWDYALDYTVSIDTFKDWLGDVNAPSRSAFREYLKKSNYNSMLDIPCGCCIDLLGLKKEGIDINYLGMDITSKLIDYNLTRGFNVKWGSIENIPLNDNELDLAYARHILEHLPHYKKAIDELIRIAKKEVLVVFFIKTTDQPDAFKYTMCDDHLLYHNAYNRDEFEKYVLSHPKVKQISWENVNETDEIAHIYLE